MDLSLTGGGGGSSKPREPPLATALKSRHFWRRYSDLQTASPPEAVPTPADIPGADLNFSEVLSGLQSTLCLLHSGPFLG